MDNYVTIFEESCAEYTEKRSKFIATARHCETEEQAAAFIDEMRSKYWDARHNVYAYSVLKGSLNKFSDDGEPHGTAGKPILDVILGSGVTDIAVVVTRYFGGILLGTGGLVRAYSCSAKDAILNAAKAQMVFCTSFSVVCDYADLKLLTSLIEKSEGTVSDTDFKDKVTVKYVIKDNLISDFSEKLSAKFSGRLVPKEVEKCTLPFKF